MKYSGGASMSDLAASRLMRAEGDGSLTDLAELPVTDQERFQKVRRLHLRRYQRPRWAIAIATR